VKYRTEKTELDHHGAARQINVNILMNMLSPPAEGNFCDKHGKGLKPARVQDESRHTR
jgi:hypothetical protein